MLQQVPAVQQSLQPPIIVRIASTCPTFLVLIYTKLDNQSDALEWLEESPVVSFIRGVVNTLS